MTPRPRIFAVLCALGLAGYAVVVLLREPPANDEAEAAWAEDEAGDPVDARAEADEARRRLAAAARAPASASDRALPLDELDVPPPPLVDGPTAEATPANARAGFDYAMRRVEALGERRRRLKPEQWESLYREANDAYAALSTVLDAGNEAELRELEDAHRRLKEGLAALRVRGKKFAY